MHNQMRTMPINTMFFWVITIVLVLIAVSIYMIMKNNKNSREPSDDTPIKILDTRFAKGEISEEEYIKMKNLINNK